jgi:hypothetical protein
MAQANTIRRRERKSSHAIAPRDSVPMASLRQEVIADWDLLATHANGERRHNDGDCKRRRAPESCQWGIGVLFVVSLAGFAGALMTRKTHCRHVY